MKTNLEFLIDWFQKEYDRLHQEINGNILNGDFESAAGMRKAYFRASSTLRLLHHLDNPNLNRMEILKSDIRNLERRIERYTAQSIPANKLVPLHTMQSKYLEELSMLKTGKRPFFQDEDTLLHFLKGLLNDAHQSIELDLRKNEIVLLVYKKKAKLYLDIKSIDQKNLAARLGSDRLIALRLMDFFAVHPLLHRKVLPIASIDNTELLTLIARIFFEVFQRYGKEGGMTNLKIVDN